MTHSAPISTLPWMENCIKFLFNTHFFPLINSEFVVQAAVQLCELSLSFMYFFFFYLRSAFIHALMQLKGGPGHEENNLVQQHLF